MDPIREKEIWKDVVGYEGVYEVSSYGKIKSVKRYHVRSDRILSDADSRGYRRIRLCRNGSSKSFSVHRLVAEAFIPNKLNKPHINHIDGDKTNNYYRNLEWCTSLENNRHAVRTGLRNTNGEKNGNSALSRNEVLQIRSVYSQGWANQYELADAFNMSQNAIKSIVNYQTWKHV